jgi:hypothetical protein
MRLRQAAPVALLIVGTVAVVFVLVARDVTWKAVWIGVASTAFASALVDASAQFESYRREGAILRVAGDRVGRVNQRLLWIIDLVFDVSMGNVDGLSRELRQLTQPSIDMAGQAQGIAPPQTKQRLAALWVAELYEALDGALILGVQTVEADRVERLDMAVRSSAFIFWIRDVVPTIPRVDGGVDVTASQAADLLDAVQAEFRFFAAQGGKRWKYGKP